MCAAPATNGTRRRARGARARRRTRMRRARRARIRGRRSTRCRRRSSARRRATARTRAAATLPHPPPKQRSLAEGGAHTASLGSVPVGLCKCVCLCASGKVWIGNRVVAINDAHKKAATQTDPLFRAARRDTSNTPVTRVHPTPISIITNVGSIITHLIMWCANGPVHTARRPNASTGRVDVRIACGTTAPHTRAPRGDARALPAQHG